MQSSSILKLRKSVARKVIESLALFERVFLNLPGRHTMNTCLTQVKNISRVQIGKYTHLCSIYIYISSTTKIFFQQFQQLQQFSKSGLTKLNQNRKFNSFSNQTWLISSSFNTQRQSSFLLLSLTSSFLLLFPSSLFHCFFILIFSFTVL